MAIFDEHESLLPTQYLLTPDARLTALNYAVRIVYKERGLSQKGNQQGGPPKGGRESGDLTAEVTAGRAGFAETGIDLRRWRNHK